MIIITTTTITIIIIIIIKIIIHVTMIIITNQRCGNQSCRPRSAMPYAMLGKPPRNGQKAASVVCRESDTN